MNCIVVDDDKISRELICSYINDTDDLDLVKECKSAIEAANYLSKNDVDLIFLDIEMPKMSGIDLLKSMQNHPQVVLITSKDKYAVEAFEFDVTDYLVKPCKYARFLKAVEKVRNNNKTVVLDSIQEDCLFVKVDSELVNIPTKEILWVEALGDYVSFMTAAKKYMVLSTMANIETRLPQSQFIRVHRSYFVRIDRIKKIAEDIILVENKLIPVSKSYKKELITRLVAK